MATRADMATALALDPTSPTKTFVLEVHTDDAPAYLADMVGRAGLELTEDAYLFRAHVGESVFWVDQIDGRFWSFHTDMRASDALAFLRQQVERRRDLDWMWLPSGHLRHPWPDSVSRKVRTRFSGEGFLPDDSAVSDLRVQLSGRSAEQLLDLIQANPEYSSAVSFDSVQTTVAVRNLGVVTEGVNRMGRFAAFGDSFELHLAFIRTVVSHYRAFVELCERKALGWDRLPDGGGVLSGGPITIRFRRPIEDMERFVTELLAVRRPFRLWGVPDIVSGVAQVEAVDLHVGQRLRFDIDREWLRVVPGARQLRQHGGTSGKQLAASLRRSAIPGRPRARRRRFGPTPRGERFVELDSVRPSGRPPR